MPIASAGQETELKFELDSAALAQLQSHPALCGAARTRRLETVYYDTPGHDLRRHGLTLRVREADGGFVQTVKRRRSADPIRRDEWECRVASRRPELGADSGAAAAEALNGEACDLTAIFSTSVNRCNHLWRQGNSEVEISVDEGHVRYGDRCEPILELELELKTGTPHALFHLARELTEHTGMRLSFESKAERGYRLAGHDRAEAIKAERTALDGDITAGAAFRNVAHSALRQISANARLVRRVGSAGALHQTRVGLRRLRSALSGFRLVVEDGHFRTLRAECRWLARELELAREIDVFLQDTFAPAEAAAPEDPALAALGERLRHAQAEAYEGAIAALTSPRFAALLLDTAAWLELGAWTQGSNPRRDAPAAGYGARVLARGWRKVVRAGRRLKKLDPTARHRLRIRAKKLRYAAEVFPAPPGGRARRRRKLFLETLDQLQGHLGRLNDIDVARTRGPGFAGPRSGDLAFTAGLIVGRREQDEPRLLKAAARAFASLADTKPFWTS